MKDNANAETKKHATALSRQTISSVWPAIVVKGPCVLWDLLPQKVRSVIVIVELKNIPTRKRRNTPGLFHMPESICA